MRNENKTHLVKFGSLSNTESLTQETKTKNLENFAHDKIWLSVYMANQSS